jgi:hypothetical protein
MNIAHTLTRKTITTNGETTEIAMSFSDGAAFAVNVPTAHVTEFTWVGALKLAAPTQKFALRALQYNLGIALQRRGRAPSPWFYENLPIPRLRSTGGDTGQLGLPDPPRPSHTYRHRQGSDQRGLGHRLPGLRRVRDPSGRHDRLRPPPQMRLVRVRQQGGPRPGRALP